MTDHVPVVSFASLFVANQNLQLLTNDEYIYVQWAIGRHTWRGIHGSTAEPWSSDHWWTGRDRWHRRGPSVCCCVTLMGRGRTAAVEHHRASVLALSRHRSHRSVSAAPTHRHSSWCSHGWNINRLYGAWPNNWSPQIFSQRYEQQYFWFFWTFPAFSPCRDATVCNNQSEIWQRKEIIHAKFGVDRPPRRCMGWYRTKKPQSSKLVKIAFVRWLFAPTRWILSFPLLPPITSLSLTHLSLSFPPFSQQPPLTRYSASGKLLVKTQCRDMWHYH